MLLCVCSLGPQTDSWYSLLKECFSDISPQGTTRSSYKLLHVPVGNGHLISSFPAKYVNGILCLMGKRDMLFFSVSFKSLVGKSVHTMYYYAMHMIDIGIRMITTEAAAHRYLKPNYARLNSL